MKRTALSTALLAALVACAACAPKTKQPRLSHEAAMQMVRDSVWANPIFFTQWDQEQEVVVTDRFEAREYELKTIILRDYTKARAALGLGPDFVILESFNHKRIGEWKDGKLKMD